MRCRKAKKNISLNLDSRLKPADREKLQDHLFICPSCRSWSQGQLLLQDLFKTPEAIQPSPGFFLQLKKRINHSATKQRFFFINASDFKSVLLRATMLVVFIVAIFLGFFLGSQLDVPSVGGNATVFSRTMNLDAFADLPADSFGAVYDRLLQGERP